MTRAADWTGRVGEVWAGEWRRTDRAFADLSRHLDVAIASVAPASGRAVDIGCGAGSTALVLAEGRPMLEVVGIDLAEPLVAVARERAETLDNSRFVAGDVMTAIQPLAPIDLFVSRHGVMFFDDPAAGFARLHDAAAPGAPLVFSCFRARSENEWSRVADEAVGLETSPEQGYQPGPYAFADPNFVEDLLARAGWRDARPRAIDVAWRVGAGDDPVADALAFFSRIGSTAPLLAEAAPPERAAMRDRLRAALADHLAEGAVTFRAAAWIWSASATGEPS